MHPPAPPRPGVRNPPVAGVWGPAGPQVFLAPALRVLGHVVGVDVSPGMLAKARERKEHDSRLGPRITLVQHSVTDLGSLATGEVPKGSFDVLICSNAFVLFNNTGQTEKNNDQSGIRTHALSN